MQLHRYTFCVTFLILFIVSPIVFFSQTKYPTDSSFVKSLYHIDKSNLKDFKNTPIDTGITHFQNYYPKNTNGNIGLPSSSLCINYNPKALGFNLYSAPYQNDIIHADNVQYFQTKGPYASLTGIAGSKQEQMFKLLFTNTFKNNLNLTVAFNRYSGLGFYKRQQTFTNNFYTSSNYKSKSGRVGYYSYFLFNKVKHLENGGIADDSLFIENTSVNKNLLPVNLSQAKREVRYTSFDFNPWFKLNKASDSIATIFHYVDYQFNYSGNYTKYADAASATDNFYKTFYIDSTQTKDSTHWRIISNGLNYTLKLNPLNIKLQIGAKHEFSQVHQFADSSFSNSIANAGFYIADKNYYGFIKAYYIFSGTNQNDYSAEINNAYYTKFAYKIFKSKLLVKLNAQFEKRHPDFIYNSWYSNHFAWNNSFNPVEKVQTQLSFSTENKRFELGMITQTIKNFIYFNEQALPQQTSFEVQNISLFIAKDILLFKHLGVGARYNYQTSSYLAVVGIPNHIVNGSLYYQGNLFKKALNLQIGFSAQYFSDFYAYAYMPATNMYYAQSAGKIGEYPYVDFFINARIKPVRFFIKIEHINQGLTGKNYTLTPGYLQNDRAFKFGLNWLFFD